MTDHPLRSAIGLMHKKSTLQVFHNAIMLMSINFFSKRSTTPMPRQRGFTMIELVVSFAILAILSVLAAPSFLQTIASNRVTSTTNDLYTTFVQARTDAVRQGKRVTVCVSGNGTSCDAASSTATWTVGWISWTDTTRATIASVDAGETVSFYVQPQDPSIRIRGNASVSNYVSFAPDGQSKQINGGFQAGRIRICSTSSSLTDASRAREIVISISGRMVIEKPTGIGAACAAPT